jgi:hypothetical protein
MMINTLSFDQIRRLCSNYRIAFFGADEARQAGIPTRTFEETLASQDGMTTETLEKVADYQEKYRFLTSGACTRLRTQQRTNGTSDSSTVEKEVP